MKRETSFNGMTDRYHFDFGTCTPKNGWAQIDTGQDASYYGNWTNPFTRQVLSYCEGDINLVTYDDDVEFCNGLRETIAWHDERGYGPAKVDGMCDERIIGRFAELTLQDILH